MQKNIATTLKHSSLYSIAAFSSRFIGIFLVPIYTRVFSPTAYGIIAGVNMFTPIVSSLVSAIPSNSVPRFYIDSNDPQDRKLTASVGLYQIIFSALILILPMVLIFPKELSALVLGDSAYSKYIVIALVTVFFSLLYNYGIDMFRFNFQSVRYAVISTAYILTTMGLSILLVVGFRMDITGALSAILISSIIFCLISIGLTRKYYSLLFSIARLKEMFIFGAPFIPVVIFGYLLTFADRYFIINYRGLDSLGVYYIGFAMASLIAALFLGFHRAWGPIILSTFRQEDAKLFYSKFLDYAFSLVILAIMAISLFSREILTVFTTEAYFGAYKVIPWLAFSMLFTQVFLWFAPGLGISKKTVHYVWILAVALGVNIALNFVLVPLYGIVGAAITTLIASAVNFFLRFIMSQRYYPIKYNFLNYSKIILISVGMLLLWHNFLLEISWQNIMIQLTMLLLLLASLFIFRLLGRTELIFAKNIVFEYARKLWRFRSLRK